MNIEKKIYVFLRKLQREHKHEWESLDRDVKRYAEEMILLYTNYYESEGSPYVLR